LSFNGEEDKRDVTAWAEARGCRIVQVGKNLVQAEFVQECPLLDKGLCKVHGDLKPNLCKDYPFKINVPELLFNNMDPNKMLPAGCGFKYALT